MRRSADRSAIDSACRKRKALAFATIGWRTLGGILLSVSGGAPFIVEVKVAIFLVGLVLGYGWGHLMWWFFNRGH